MNKDINESFLGEGVWTHARNAVNNSHDGEVGTIQNEPATLHCLNLPYTYLGSARMENSRFVVFSGDDYDSEIGIYDEDTCEYTKVVNDSCLGFKRTNLITAVCRRTFDCSIKVYWADALNPDRVMDLNNPPFIKETIYVGNCATEVNTDQLDCEQLRLAPLLTIPCLNLIKAKGSGNLLNGTYQVAIAYTINQIKVTDYLILSNPVAIWSHSGVGGALELSVSNTDQDFEEMEVVVISTVKGQTQAKRLGIYSIRQDKIYIDNIDPTLINIPLENIPLQSPAIEKSDALYNVSDYLIRTGVYTKPDFNYQPLANQIITKWDVLTVPADYYNKGGVEVGYMRGEVYSFFIRWVYNTGERSASYHIPGRASGTPLYSNMMDFWESEERYPDNQQTVWGNLCGEKIRHHKIPDNSVTNHYNPGGATINILGVKFERIKHPLDNNGNPITSIVGYEILRGSREGHRSIVAKGMLNNMREFTINGSQKGLTQNFPYNQLTGDPYFDNNTATVHKNEYLSFHSPDTVFENPYLGNPGLEIYEKMTGTVNGVFETPYKHPEFKIIGKTADVIADVIAGVTQVLNLINSIGGLGVDITLGSTEDLPINIPLTAGQPSYIPFVPGYGGTGGVAPDPVALAGNTASVAANVGILANNTVTAVISQITGIIGSTITGFITANITRQKLLDIVTGLIPSRQYAAQYNSHGFYDNYSINKYSFNIEDYTYVGGSLQSFDNFSVNNYYRNNFVLIKTDQSLPELSGDNSRFTLRTKNASLNTPVTSSTSAYYGALKVNLPSQYGQLESIRQLPITSCIYETTPSTVLYFSTPLLFGGDTYIGRYTEKNPFSFFNDWLVNQPTDVIYNYRDYYNLPKPNFWVDNRKAYEGFFTSLSNFYSLDEDNTFNDNGFFVKPGHFYLFCNGVRDFFVETEVNIAFRDYEDDPFKRFYDPYGYTDLSSMFRSDGIKTPASYLYDYSLSTSKTFNNFVSWGQILPRTFDPAIAESCYSYYPRRVIYSLPQSEELKKDNWQSFLVNNYKDFTSKVTAIKSLGKTGAIIMLEDESPIIFQGVDTLETDAGTKITIGDGGLFNQALQNISNADKSYQFGSCQNRFSISSTPAGVFWVSQEQGKIFNYSGGLEDISRNGMKWWFSRYLPSKLLKEFPDFELKDNPVIGVGVMTVYDNTNEILYISKRDYVPKVPLTYVSGNKFSQDGPFQSVPVELGNPLYFEDVSWTISYDVKNKMWLSFHDWHPLALIPTKSHFISVKNNGQLWKHNERCDLFCNYYGVDYPFEVEYVSATGTSVTTMRGVEYYLECYEYKNNCQDRFHLLDQNFDRAIVYNSEQASGLLKLNLYTKDDPVSMLQYPIAGPNGTDILYSKEENKYRFNTVFDVTKDRGEFDINHRYQLFKTDGNGYTFELNPIYLDYYKPILQRKKFRHYNNRVFLRKNVCGTAKMIFRNIITKVQLSSR